MEASPHTLTLDRPRPAVAMLPLTLGHCAADLAQGAMAALVPLLADQFDLSYLQVGGILLAATISSSIVQPLFGLWSDKASQAWVMPASVVAAGVGVSLLAWAPSYELALCCVVISGLGVAAFHPEGSTYAAWVSGERRSTWMAMFAVGGNVGIALGPLLAAALTHAWGIEGAALLVLPGLAVACLLVLSLPALERAARAGRRAARAAIGAGRDRWDAMAILLVGVTARGYVHFGLLGFLPLFEERVRGNSAAHGAAVLSLMLASGAAGTVGVGAIADRTGRRRAYAGSFALSIPGLALYLAVPGPLGLVGIALAGVGVISTFALTMTLSQEYLPSRMALATGLSIGLSIGLGGVAALAMGALADSVGIEKALWTTVAASVLGTVLALLLPPPIKGGEPA